MRSKRGGRSCGVVFFAVLIGSGVVSVSWGDEINWVGYQGCAEGAQLASFFHGDNWLNYLVPGEEDVAIFDPTFDPQGNGMPYYIHFGNFCVNQFPCPNPIEVPGGDASVQNLWIRDGSWTFDFQSGSWLCGSPPPPLEGSLICLHHAFVGMTTAAGQPGDADLTIRNGTFSTGRLCLVPDANSCGRVVVDGASASMIVGQVDACYVGLSGGEGNLDIQNGADVLVEAPLVIGNHPNGFVRVMGQGSALEVDNSITTYSYPFSRGAISILDGGSVACEGPISLGTAPTGHFSLYIEGGTLASGAWGRVYGGGQAVITGPGGLWTNASGPLFIGDAGLATSGSLHVSDGATLRSAAVAIEVGTLTVAGSGSVVETSCGIATGQILVSAGGGIVGPGNGVYVASDEGCVAEVTIEGPGSAWTGIGQLTVGGGHYGQNGNGSIAIREGGELSAAYVDLGVSTRGRGSISVADAGSTFRVEGGVWIGSGHGELSVTTGAHVECAAATIGISGSEASPEASVILTGAGTLLTCQGQLLVGERCPGVLSVSQGARVIAHPLVIGPYGRLIGDGTVEGDVVNNETISPGNSPGVLALEGNYTQGGEGTLLIELAGTTPGNGYDVLQVTGEATLAGRLEVRFIDGYDPTPGSQYDVLFADSIAGEFSDVSPAGGAITVEYLHGLVRVTVNSLAGVPGQSFTPDAFALRVTGGSPLRHSDEIRWSCDLPTSASLTIGLHDVVGRAVVPPQTILSSAGRCAGRISGVDPGMLATGVYFVSAEAGEFRDVQRIVIVR